MSKEKSNPQIDSKLEARIVALVLGEASDLEREELEHLVAERPELAEFRDQIQSVHGLLEDVATGESVDADEDWKLPADKRDALLAVIDGEAGHVESDSSPLLSMQAENHALLPGGSLWSFSRVAAVFCVVGSVGLIAFLGSVGRDFATSRVTSRDRKIATETEKRSNYDSDANATMPPEFAGYRLNGVDAIVEQSVEQSSSASALSALQDTLERKTLLPSPYYLSDDVQYVPVVPRPKVKQEVASLDVGGSREQSRSAVDQWKDQSSKANTWGSLEAPSRLRGEVTDGGWFYRSPQPAAKSLPLREAAPAGGELGDARNFQSISPEPFGESSGLMGAVQEERAQLEGRGRAEVRADVRNQSKASESDAIAAGNQRAAIVDRELFAKERTEVRESTISVPDGGTVLFGGVKNPSIPGSDSAISDLSAVAEPSDRFVSDADRRAVKNRAQQGQSEGIVEAENNQVESLGTRMAVDMPQFSGGTEHFYGLQRLKVPSVGGESDKDLERNESMSNDEGSNDGQMGASGHDHWQGLVDRSVRNKGSVDNLRGIIVDESKSIDADAPNEELVDSKPSHATLARSLDDNLKENEIALGLSDRMEASDGELFDNGRVVLDDDRTREMAIMGERFTPAPIIDAGIGEPTAELSESNHRKFRARESLEKISAMNRLLKSGDVSGNSAVDTRAFEGGSTARNGQTLPSPYYLQDDVQYFPAGPEFKLPREDADIDGVIESNEGREFGKNDKWTWDRPRSLSGERKDKIQRFDDQIGAAVDYTWRAYVPPALPLKKRDVARTAAPAGLNEQVAEAEPFSTFSLHVSDVSFKLSQAALARGEWPEPSTVRIEEFVNAFDYGDPMPSQDERVACCVEQAIHPFLQQRNLLRVSMRTAAAGRSSNTPLRLTLLLDNSGSMERMDRQQTVRRAFSMLASQLKPIDQVTLISFARTPRLLADKVSGAQSAQLVQLIDGLPSEGGTNMEAALQLAFEKAKEQQVQGDQNRIILLTDGAVNLGDANPDGLSRMIIAMRDQGIAFDAAGISADGLNDEVLEALTRKGDGRYYLLDSVEAADDGFAQQIAGALRPSAKNVKVQIEFNPKRVGRYKLLGFEKHRLKQEDFRDDSVDAAEMAAREAGVAMYQFEAKPDGEGDVGSVSVRFQDLSTGRMVEHRWPIPYQADAPRVEQAAPSMRVATCAALLAATLRGNPLGESVDLRTLSELVSSLPATDRSLQRVRQLQTMIEQARQVHGK